MKSQTKIAKLVKVLNTVPNTMQQILTKTGYVSRNSASGRIAELNYDSNEVSALRKGSGPYKYVAADLAGQYLQKGYRLVS